MTKKERARCENLEALLQAMRLERDAAIKRADDAERACRYANDVAGMAIQDMKSARDQRDLALALLREASDDVEGASAWEHRRRALLAEVHP